jgi:hypothetical protein
MNEKKAKSNPAPLEAKGAAPGPVSTSEKSIATEHRNSLAALAPINETTATNLLSFEVVPSRQAEIRDR